MTIMNGCMPDDKPLISILMAVYEPNLDWLREQLLSLDAQTYPNLRLLIRDDCSPTIPFEAIRSCVQECIHSIPYIIRQNKKNLGSNLTFEQLTGEAEGDYFAYCDQDDIWFPYKLDILQEIAERGDFLLVCSDMQIINGRGQITANSITKIRRHHYFRSGKGLAENLLCRNFVTGCTMLIRAEQAKAAIPFCPYMVHDHYLALWCAEKGEILSVREPLIQYRIHGGNQTELLAGVRDKQSYGKFRIDTVCLRLQWLKTHFVCGEELHRAINDTFLWAEARSKNWRRCGGKRIVWKYRRFNPLVSIFELCTVYLPEPVFRLLIFCGQRNWI